MSHLELQRTQLVPRSLDETFAFFADALNLEAITPPWLVRRLVAEIFDYRADRLGELMAERPPLPDAAPSP